MKYLVTGGAGFIGSNLVRQLCATGNDVVVLDNFSTGKADNLHGLPVQLHEGDIRDSAMVARAVEGVDVVFHEAALCSVARSVEDPLASNDVNVTGTLTVLEACRKAGVKRVVFASSSSVYGDSNELMKHENLVPDPLSPYAVTKLAGEYYCRMYARLFGLETVVLRYFNVFGPHQRPDSHYAAVIPRFMLAIREGKHLDIYGDGLQTRDFTYVDNIVQANIAAASSKNAAGNVINVACGERWSLIDLAETLKSVLQLDVGIDFHPERAGDVKHSLAGIERAGRLLGYRPGVGFDDGIRRTVDWFFAEDSSRQGRLQRSAADAGASGFIAARPAA